MTSAEENVRAGRLDEALSELQAQVRKNPADARLRVFLFQLLVVRGDWDRALTQLRVASDMDASTVAMLKTYQEALRCEALRAEVFAGRRTPLLFGKPAEWMALLVEAMRLTANEKYEEARSLRERAFESAPAMAGAIDDQPFAWIADADSRLGPLMEAIVNGRYYWIPFSRIKEVRIEKPQDLRDIVWMPASLSLANGGDVVAFIPTRYPGSETAKDPRVVMARSTEWQERPADTFLGLGQRLWTTDQGEHALMDVRVVRIDNPESDVDATPEMQPGPAEGQGN
jgi:type VI secretion system protein ImpE